MADRYWVGGTAAWDGTAGTKWAATSGGAGGESVPTSADDVYFDENSSGTCTISSGNTGAKSINCTGFTGALAGTAAINVWGSITLVPAMTFTFTGITTIRGDATITSAGKTLPRLIINGNGITVNQADALNLSSQQLNIERGTYNTNNYNLTCFYLQSDGTNVRTLNLGSSLVTVSFSSGVLFNATNFTFNAGTSTLVFTASTTAALSAPGSFTFHDVAFIGTGVNGSSIIGSHVFNNLSFAAPSSSTVRFVSFDSSQTINGTLTLSAGSNATQRTFVRSNVIGETRTLTCANVASLTDIDFRDVTIAGAAAPVSGTRLGDCKGNSGITFDAPKTVYYRSATANNMFTNAWSATDGGSLDFTLVPLAQDTAVFQSYPNSGVTITVNGPYNIGTIDMSARTSNTMTLACSQSPFIYGNWINGTGTTLSGTGTLTFAGRGSQTITSAGKTFTQGVTVDTPGGSVTLQDAFTSNRNASNALILAAGSFSADIYNVSFTGPSAQLNFASTSRTRSVDVGSGTWTIASATGGAWNATNSTNLTVTGTGTINLTSTSAKTFIGGGIQTYPTLNQGGTGTLTVTGSNKFAGLTNTAIGRIQFTGGTTNEFTSFVINGASGNLLQLGSTSTTAVTLRKTGAWNVGANSTDGGNNTGLSFTAGDMDYLSISYVNGEVLTPTGTLNIYFGATNIQDIYYGNSPVSAIYYGNTLVFEK